jgi:hypothetical protein
MAHRLLGAVRLISNKASKAAADKAAKAAQAMQAGRPLNKNLTPFDLRGVSREAEIELAKRTRPALPITEEVRTSSPSSPNENYHGCVCVGFSFRLLTLVARSWTSVRPSSRRGRDTATKKPPRKTTKPVTPSPPWTALFTN